MCPQAPTWQSPHPEEAARPPGDQKSPLCAPVPGMPLGDARLPPLGRRPSRRGSWRSFSQAALHLAPQLFQLASWRLSEGGYSPLIPAYSRIRFGLRVFLQSIDHLPWFLCLDGCSVKRTCGSQALCQILLRLCPVKSWHCRAAWLPTYPTLALYCISCTRLGMY